MDIPSRLRGLDLFSGIGGISQALEPWVRTVAYCERDRYAQGVLLSRMERGEIDCAPIWDDITTLSGDMLPPPSISSSADSHVRISATQGVVRAWRESEAAYSMRQQDLFENVNLSSYSSKMSEESESPSLSSGASLRRLATIAETDFCRLLKSGQITIDSAGFYLPTPCARDWRDANYPAELKRKTIPLAVRFGGRVNPKFLEWMMGYPIGATELQPLVTAWFISKSGKRLKH